MGALVTGYHCKHMIPVPESDDTIVIYLRSTLNADGSTTKDYVLGTISGGQSLPADRMPLEEVIEIALLLAQKRAEENSCQKDMFRTN